MKTAGMTTGGTNIILDNIRDSKLMQLYAALTKSDLKGHYEDTYMVEILFTVLTLDLIINSDETMQMDERDIMRMAKEIVRIYERDDKELSYFSVRNWTEALFAYMDETKKDYDAIHRMNTYDLRKEVSGYLRKSDD